MLDADHLQAAHRLWRQTVQKGDITIDATTGNGFDSLILSQLCLEEDRGAFWGLDIQESAIQTTRERLEAALSADQMERVHLHLQSHAQFPSAIPLGSVSLIVYNLGYLPGGPPSLITKTSSTLQSLQHALELLAPGGLISCTCYSGHPGGEDEERSVLNWARQLPRRFWTVQHLQWPNRRNGPTLLLIERKLCKS